MQLLTIRPPVLCKNQGFIKAGELVIGYELLNSNCNVLLVENFDVELTDDSVKVYNFQVEDFHTYHVSGFGVLVHNAEYSPEKMQKNKSKAKSWSRIRKKINMKN
ncbi:polymorphic toxin-type HINT domain-containing protein [Ruminococcus sp.]|uniref:polymorphic toxin-type HINT domain-containing protein n=1 Tax=Ruminococcus sp. TaxID=41978 RepID=UPI003967AF6B